MRGKSKVKTGIAPCRIGIDLLGSDVSPPELLKAVLSFCKDIKPTIRLTLFGTASLFDRIRPPSNHITFHVVKEVITMDEAPLTAIRRKRNSSLCTGIRMLKSGELQAFISAGNTGALMACAKIELPSLPGVDRPALLTLLPTRLNEIAVLMSALIPPARPNSCFNSPRWASHTSGAAE